MRQLIAARADPNQATRDGVCPLHYAADCAGGDTTILRQLLVHAGTDVNAAAHEVERLSTRRCTALPPRQVRDAEPAASLPGCCAIQVLRACARQQTGSTAPALAFPCQPRGC